MQCNICKQITDTPKYYKPQISPNNQIIDRSSNPELKFTTVDFLVSDGYWHWLSRGPIYMILIDASDSMYQTNL